MNLRAVAWLPGCILLLLADFLLVPAAVSFVYAETASVWACVVSSLVTALAGGILVWRNRGSTISAEGHRLPALLRALVGGGSAPWSCSSCASRPAARSPC